jgi:hypothetical protein
VRGSYRQVRDRRCERCAFRRRKGGCNGRNNLQIGKDRDVASLQKFDPNRIFFAFLIVVFRQAGAEFAGLHANNAVLTGIKGLGASEDLSGDRVFFDAISTFNGPLHSIAEKILLTFSGTECATRKNFL